MAGKHQMEGSFYSSRCADHYNSRGRNNRDQARGTETHIDQGRGLSFEFEESLMLLLRGSSERQGGLTQRATRTWEAVP